MKRPSLILLFLVVLTFSLAAWVQPKLPSKGAGRDSDNVFKVFFGEGRRLFASHFVAKADEYFHGGAYPSFFELAARAEDKAKEEEDAKEEAGHQHTADCKHEPAPEPEHQHTADCKHGQEAEHGQEGHDESNCKTIEKKATDAPLDWIEAVGRNFIVTGHSHLAGGKEREMLPWLKLAADLDPQRIETYLVTSYYLAGYLKKPKDAEDFLRQGLQANPQSYEILFELGNLYDKHLDQPDRARNIWLLGLRRWDEVERERKKAEQNRKDAEEKTEPDNVMRSRLLINLAEFEIKQGNKTRALEYLEDAKKYSPNPAGIEERIKKIHTDALLGPSPFLAP